MRAVRARLASLPWAVALPLIALGCGDGVVEVRDATVPSDAAAPPDAAAPDLTLFDLAPPPPDLVRVPGESVLQYHKNASRDGVYVDPAITRAAAARLRRDPSFVVKVAGPTYAQPLFLDGGPGGRDLLFVATEQNQVSAFDARTGQVVWQRTLAPSVPKARFSCGNIDPLGITGTPVIDFASRQLFLETMTSPDGGATKQRLVHALDLDDGRARPGWPVDAGVVLPKLGAPFFFPQYQNQRGALALLDGRVYVPYGGLSGDCGTYKGIVLGVRIDDPTQVSAWWTRGGYGGVWAPAGMTSDGKSLFVATGNTGGVMQWSDGEAAIRLGPGPTYSQKPQDYFSPTDWLQLDAQDLDVGGTAPMLLDAPGGTPSRLLVALGKNGRAYVLDRDNLGGVGGELWSGQVTPGVIIGGAATWTTDKGTYLGFRGYGECGQFYNLVVLKLVVGAPPRLDKAFCIDLKQVGSPIVTTTDGRAEPILWALGAESDSRLHGYDADTGAVIFAGGGPGDALAEINRFQTPIVAKGRIYVAGANEVAVFSAP